VENSNAKNKKTYVVVDIEELKNMSDAEIMEYIKEGEKPIKDTFHITNIILDNQLRFKSKLNIQEILSRFEFDNENGKYSFPFFSEKELPIYKNKMNGSYKVPAKGFYWEISHEITRKPFGVIEVDFKIGKLVRNDNDWRWEKDDKPDHQEKKIWFYDYAHGVFRAVHLREDNKQKKKQKKSEEEEVSVRDVYIEEYIRRLELIDYHDEKMGEIEENYTIELNKAISNVTSYIKDIDKTPLVSNYKNLLDEFEEFYKYFEKFFPVKLTFKHIDLFEFEELKTKMGELNAEVVSKSNELKLLADKYKNEQDINLTTGPNRDGQDVKDIYASLSVLSNKILSIMEPKYIRKIDWRKSEDIVMQGYAGYTKERLIPSLGTIETRRNKSVLPMKKQDWEKYEKMLLNKLNEDASGVEQGRRQRNAARELFVSLNEEEKFNALIQEALRDDTGRKSAIYKFSGYVTKAGKTDIRRYVDDFHKEVEETRKNRYL
jgi:hypothetical protein